MTGASLELSTASCDKFMHAIQQSCHGQLVATLRRKAWLPLAILAWAVAVGISWKMILEYGLKSEPASPDATSLRWPSDTNLVIVPNRPTVVFFVHPKCPCTRASLAELERLWVLRDARANHSPQLIVVVTIPPKATSDWLTTRTVERASNLPGATLAIDPEGRVAQRFGASTSGAVMWFDAAGECRYAGGLTASRGHEGDNLGRSSLERLLRGATQPVSSIPALGCKLCLPK